MSERERERQRQEPAAVSYLEVKAANRVIRRHISRPKPSADDALVSDKSKAMILRRCTSYLDRLAPHST